MISNEVPSAQGFRMPAEWEKHAATWLAWPHEESDWPGKFEPIGWIYGEIVRHLSRQERVNILVEHEEAEQQARGVLEKSGADLTAVNFFRVPTDRSWTRDFCPTFLSAKTGGCGVLNWLFNGWAKYDNSRADREVTATLSNLLGWKRWIPLHDGERIVLEGGSIDVNGSGSLLTTEECLLSDIQARNPQMNRSDYERAFRDYLGVTNTLWLRRGIAGDDTHGHVDDLARFVDRSTVVIASEENPKDENFEPLQENLQLLKTMRDEGGNPLRVETLPMPQPVWFDGQQLPASYANFYIANGIVLVPTFNDPQDRIALNKLAGLFPDRRVVGIASTDLVLGLGTLHCMTQQQPAC